MTSPPSITRCVPMSSAQRRLFLQCQVPSGDRAYHLVHIARIRGPFPLDAAQTFANRMVARHDALRCAFRFEEGKFVCEVRDRVDIHLTVLEGENFDPEKDLDALVDVCDQPFDLANPPLFRAFIRPVGPSDRILILVCHHLIFDGYSAALIAREMQTLLSGGKLEPLERGYADFAEWESSFIASEEYARQRDFWLGQYQTPPTRLTIPTDYPRPAHKSFEGASLIDYLDSRAMKALSVSRGATLFITLLAAFFCALHRFTGQREITLGTLVSPREAGGFGKVIGLFANTLPLTACLDPEVSFESFLDQVRTRVLDAMQNAEYPFEHLVAALPFIERDEHNPLLNVVFNFERTARRRVDIVGDTTIETIDRYADVSMFDLAVDLVEYESEVRFRVEYSTALFREETVRGLLDGYFAIVRQVCDCPDTPIRKLSPISDEAWKRISAWNDTGRPIAAGTFLDVWRKQAKRQADYPALRLGDNEISYDRVETRSNRLAHVLIERGARPGAVIAAALDGSIDWPILLLAIWKIGAVYLPVSPNAPALRTARQLEDTAAVLLVTRAADREVFTGFPIVTTIEELNARAHSLPTDDPGPGPTPDDPAYIIYTSGSSGKPKGVVIGHRSVHTHVDAVRGVYRLRPDDNVLQFASPTFDASLEQVLVALAAGSCSVLVASRFMDPKALLDEIEAREITVAEFPPALLRELIPHLKPRSLRRLRRLISGGNALDARTASEVARFLPSEARLLNIYGPTEATMAASVFTVPADLSRWTERLSLPIGKPLPNTRFHVVGPENVLLPPGVPGELCITGDRLAHGYLNRPDTTAERFVKIDIRGVTERVYKTGDRVRLLQDGDIEFIGRLDRQVKLRGYRIELSEIELTLLGCPDVEEAIVVTRGGEDVRLVAFVVPRRTAQVDEGGLLEQLRERLPEYMIPSTIMVVEALAKNAAGKIDLGALSETNGRGSGPSALELPVDSIEWAVWDIWRRILGGADFGRNDTLLRVGGNSLTAVRIMVEVRNRFGVDPPLSMMLKSPTVAELACFLRGVDANAPLRSVVALGDVIGGAPVILLPGIGGQLLDLQELSRHLSADHRVLGIQYPAEGKDAARIEDLVRRFERDLDRETELSGAILVGHSFGAHVAIELARRLEASGIRPWAVIALDAAPPGGQWTQFSPSRAALVDLAVWTLLGKRDEAVWPANPANADMDKLLGKATALLKSEGRVPNDTDGATFGRGLDVIAARANSLATYVPAGPIQADIHLFKVAEPVAEEDDWDWAPHTQGIFRRHTTPGGHFDMIKGENASVLADLIRKAASTTTDDWTGRTK